MFNEPVSPMLLITGVAIALWVTFYQLGFFYDSTVKANQIQYLGPPPDICWNFVTCQDL